MQKKNMFFFLRCKTFNFQLSTFNFISYLCSHKRKKYRLSLEPCSPAKNYLRFPKTLKTLKTLKSLKSLKSLKKNSIKQ